MSYHETKKLVVMYQNFFISDGTYDTNFYDLMIISFFIIECLKGTDTVGIILNYVENANTTFKAYKRIAFEADK